MLPDNHLSDPRVFGPGLWYSLHRSGIRANTDAKKQIFVTDLKDLPDDIPCKGCGDHIRAYIVDNPIEVYWNVYDEHGDDIGMFKWTWTFHNAVNSRLGKPFMPWDTAYLMFKNPADVVCTSTCDESPADPVMAKVSSPHMSTGGIVHNQVPTTPNFRITAGPGARPIPSFAASTQQEVFVKQSPTPKSTTTTAKPLASPPANTGMFSFFSRRV